MADNLTTTEAADYLGLPASTLIHWRHRRRAAEGPQPLWLGKRVFYTRDSLDTWVKEQMKKSKL